MSDGFRNTTPRGSVLISGSNLGSFVGLPLTATTGDVSAFNSLEIAIVATGSSGGTTGLLQLQFHWFDQAVNGRLIWVDTVEVNFEQVGNFLGKQAYVLTPVRGAFLTIFSNAGTSPPTSPTVQVNVYGLTTPVGRVICWNDQASFRGTDLLIGAQSGGAIASGGSVGPFHSGLASGGVMVQFTVAFTTGAAVLGQARLRTTFGSSGFGWPDIYINQPVTTYPLGISDFFVGYVPRRPVICTVADTAGGSHNTINSWNYCIIADEP